MQLRNTGIFWISLISLLHLNRQINYNVGLSHSAFSTRDSKNLCLRRISLVNLSKLDELADVIIIDTGAGISDNVLEFVMASPEILLLATSEPSSLTDAYSLLKALHRNEEFRQAETKIKVISIIVRSLFSHVMAPMFLVQDNWSAYQKLLKILLPDTKAECLK